MNEELAEELEALKYTYWEELTVDDSSQSGGDVRITLLVSPRTALDNTKRFVEAIISFSVSQGYPEVAPELEVTGNKGLGEERAKMYEESLRAEAKALQGELMLGQICEVAFEMLTELNKPEGGACVDMLRCEKIFVQCRVA